MNFFGKKAVLDAFKNKVLKKVYYANDFSELKEFQSNHIETIKVNKSFFNQFDVNHKFIMGVSNQKEFCVETEFNNFINKVEKHQSNKKIILILDEIQDAGNFGAICRTCSAFDVCGIVFKKNNQVQINDFVIKTSLGTVNYLNFLKTSNLNEVVKKLKNNGFWIVCTTLNEKSIALSKFKSDIDKFAIIVGNENNGVSPILQKNSDFLIKIDMSNYVQSLNVSVSVGIIIYYLLNCLKK
ncbi:MAG: 23S rRNA (guanosine(2251)-2'-O)-methyltransferase RlmB [Malacoplasma sp.]|nr:23S rRNA (guanosine(2251)-2'-O)-methyltransferase RlmB [Malacoplasma sp.]